MHRNKYQNIYNSYKMNVFSYYIVIKKSQYMPNCEKNRPKTYNRVVIWLVKILNNHIF